jgi:ATP-dependent Clp protease adapter protein ClpS
MEQLAAMAHQASVATEQQAKHLPSRVHQSHMSVVAAVGVIVALLQVQEVEQAAQEAPERLVLPEQQIVVAAVVAVAQLLVAETAAPESSSLGRWHKWHTQHFAIKT